MAITNQQVRITEAWSLAVTKAVEDTFFALAGCRPKADKAEFNNKANVHSDISGLMVMSQTQADGAMILSFPKETIFHVLAKIYRKSFSDLNQSVQQGVGEFTNVIFGGLIANLNKSGYAFQMGQPSVVIGNQHIVVQSKSGQRMTIPFEIENYPFHVTVQINNQQESTTGEN